MLLALSLLHLVEDRDAVIARVHRAVKPGGLFVTSTTCLSDFVGWLRFIAPLGRAIGRLPLLRFFTADELRDSLVRAGFAIEHDWQPGKSKALFIVARKPAD